MREKKRITLGDVMAHIRGMRSEFNTRLDRIDACVGRVEHRLTGIEHRLGRLETSLAPSHTRLQITVRDHASRMRKLEKRVGLVAA